MFIIYASYGKNVTPSVYYIKCRNPKCKKSMAKKVFLKTYPWLNYIFRIDEVECSENFARHFSEYNNNHSFIGVVDTSPNSKEMYYLGKIYNN